MPPPTTALATLSVDRAATAVVSPLDLVADLDAALGYFDDQYFAEYTEVFLAGQMDANLYDNNAAGGALGEFGNNGILDAAELYLLEYLLKTATHPLHAEVRAAYEYDLALLYAKLAEAKASYSALVYPAPAPAPARTWAAYNTLDDASGSLAAWMFLLYVKKNTNNTLSPDVYNAGFRRVGALHYASDLDGDLSSNLAEWENHLLRGGDFSNPASRPGWTARVTDQANVPQFVLTTSVSGNGSVAPEPGTYAVGTPVELTATADADWMFDHWQGGLTERDNPGYITMDSDKNVTAVFVPLRTLMVVVIGEGTVTPSGGTFGEGTLVSLSAAAAPDWIFWRWLGPVADENAAETTVELADDSVVTAEFVYRPGIDTLDFAGAFAEFLVAIGYNETLVPYDLNVDTGDTDPDSGALTGNGIPDVAELALLEQVLRTPAAEFGYEGGISHALLWDGYEHNRVQAQTDLAGQPDCVVTTAAAYMTLGTSEHQQAMVHWLENDLGLAAGTVDPANYVNEEQSLLWPDGDADADGTSNLSEWNEAVAQAPGDAGAAVLDYGSKAASPAETAGATAWNAPAISESDWQAALAAACSTATVSVLPSTEPNLTVSARAFAPGSESGRDVPIGSATDVPVGTRLEVKATPAAWFDYWDAPEGAAETLIDGSARASEKVIVNGDVVIEAVPKMHVWFAVFDTVWNLCGSLTYGPTGKNPLILSTEDIYDGEDKVGVIVEARAGTLLRLTAHRGLFDIFKVGVGADDPGGDYASLNTSARAFPGTVRPACYSPINLSGFGAATVSGANGTGSAGYIPHDQSISNPFVDQVVFAIHEMDLEGNWTEYTTKGFHCFRGFFHYAWRGPLDGGGFGEVAPYAFLLAVPNQDNPNPVYRAVVKRKKEIHIDPPRCRGGCTAPYHGGVDVTPARKYYWPARDNLLGGYIPGDIVRLDASPDCGHIFYCWRLPADTHVYESDLHNEDPDGPPFSLNDLRPLAPVQVAGTPGYIAQTIYVEITKDLEIKPQFWDCLHCGLGSNGGGTESVGSLLGDIPLPAGTGYYQADNDSDYNGCKYYIHNTLQNVGATWYQYAGFNFGITSISKPGGGYSGHKSHQNGCDADMRYVRTDGAQDRYQFGEHPLTLYDKAATQQLVDRLVSEGATYLAADERAGLVGVDNIAGHEHHFHVRFPDPDGPPPAHCPVCQSDCM